MNKEEENKFSNSIISLYEEIKKQGENTGRELAKINLALGEMRLSYMKTNEKLDNLSSEVQLSNKKLDNLSADFNKYASSNDALVKGHEKRIVRLEGTTFGGSSQAYIAKEPVIPYKKRKKKK